MARGEQYVPIALVKILSVSEKVSGTGRQRGDGRHTRARYERKLPLFGASLLDK